MKNNKTENGMLLSIICPAYNVENSIERLAKSLIKIKRNDFEFIIVNDGSIDNTIAVLKEIEKKYSNIRVIDKPNEGPGITRNRGIDEAKGKFITFADGDDYYSDNFLLTIMKQLEEYDNSYGMLVFNANYIDDKGKIYDKCTRISKDTVYEGNDFVQRYLQGNFCNLFGNAPWNKIYIRDIIVKNNLKFPEKRKGQDLIFNIAYVAKISSIKYVNECLYNYCNSDMNYSRSRTYKLYEISENLLYYDYLKKICIDNNIGDYEHYIGLFYLRRFPGIFLNQLNCSDYGDAKKQLNEYVRMLKERNIYSNIRFRNLDLKLFLSYVALKLKGYKLLFPIWYRVRNR